jgi:hypothetical protein
MLFWTSDFPLPPYSVRVFQSNRWQCNWILVSVRMSLHNWQPCVPSVQARERGVFGDRNEILLGPGILFPRETESQAWMQSTKQSLLGWLARVELPHGHAGPVRKTRPWASLGEILYRPRWHAYFRYQHWASRQSTSCAYLTSCTYFTSCMYPPLTFPTFYMP